ncbi:MAG: STAS domain-containing protein [Ruminococcus sp.]|nr:STAS domain-containing protein [Ruminococcus sp.]
MMDNIQELREIVNPVFNTAKSCVQLVAAAGDEDSRKLLGVLGFGNIADKADNKGVPPQLAEKVKQLFPVYAVLTESRFQVVNNLIQSVSDRIVVDLPCGYTARGIKMSRQGRVYYGFDLPAVIDEIGPAAAKIHSGDQNIHYDAVDATNYDSMAAPLEDEKRELLITTEGLLMYFSQQELEEVFSNIRRILQKHGGSWIIVDRAFSFYANDQKLAGAILDNDPEMVALFSAITKKAAGAVADVKFYDNIIFQGTDEEITTFIEKMGFELKEISMADYLPDHLKALSSMPQAEARVKDVFRNMYFWELTVKGKREEETEKVLPFRVESECKDGKFTAMIQGRMDTITAPELLEQFRKADKVKAIELHIEKMSYISSAGLRVLLMMYKSLENKDQFKLVGMTDSVKEIMEVTGFDQFLL